LHYPNKLLLFTSRSLCSKGRLLSCRSTLIPLAPTGLFSTTSTTVVPSMATPVEAPVTRELDKKQFDKTIQVVALRLPARLCTDFIKSMNKTTDILLDLPKMKRIVGTGVDGEDDQRLILLSPNKITSLDQTTWPAELQQVLTRLTSASNTSRAADAADAAVATTPTVPMVHPCQWYQVGIGFDNYNAAEILKQLLPAGVEVPSSFEQIGTYASVFDRRNSRRCVIYRHNCSLKYS
jgi:hypothetical protein